MGFAIENSRSNEALAAVAMEAEIAKLRTLQEMYSILDQEPVLADAVSRLFGLLDERCKLQRCMLSMVDERTREVRVVVAVGLSARGRALGRYQLGEGITGRVVLSGCPVIVPQVNEEPLFLNRTGALAASEERAFICVPLKSSGRTIGALSAFARYERAVELSVKCDFLCVVAAMIAQSLLVRKTTLGAEDMEQAAFIPQVTIPHKADLGSLVGTSNAILTVMEQALQVAAAKTTVLIRGESGTGKELVAELIHHNSLRAQGPFVKVNCGALPESLIDTELFGHERGAFTGAHAQRKGRFELANGGTIFLDEIGEITPAIQTKLLRVLQEREFERVGGTQTIQTDVRLIAATNKDLERAINEGKFREDLYYRLNVFPVFVPPLRERKPDILLLADHFVEKYAREYGKLIKRISTPAIDMMMSYHWPGNVRELENCIERAVVLCNDEVIHSHHLPLTLQTAEGSGTILSQSLNSAVAALEREMIMDALKTTRGNQAQAAKLLQTSERVVNYKVKKFGIDCRRFLS
jgi:Nif-specific regulatory protein